MRRAAVIAVVCVFALLGIGGVVLIGPTAEKPPERDYAGEYQRHHEARYPPNAEAVQAFKDFGLLGLFSRLDAEFDVILNDAIERLVPPEMAAIFPRPGYFEDLRRLLLTDEPASERDFLHEELAYIESVLADARPRARATLLKVFDDPEALALVERMLSLDAAAPEPGSEGPIARYAWTRDAGFRVSPPGVLEYVAPFIEYSEDPAARLMAFEFGLLMSRLAGVDANLTGLRRSQHGYRGVLSAALDGVACEERPIQDPKAWLATLLSHQSLEPPFDWHLEGSRLIALEKVELMFEDGGRGFFTGNDRPLAMMLVSHKRVYDIVNEFYDAVSVTASLWHAQRDLKLADPRHFRPSIHEDVRDGLESVLPLAMVTLEGEAAHRAIVGGTATALALAAYRQDHQGRWPDTLEELVPEYLEAVPEDPYADSPGQPMIYRVGDSGSAVLYSRGPDLTDNGGVMPKDAGYPQPGDDLVFLPRGD